MPREKFPPPADLDKEAKQLWREARDQVAADNDGDIPKALVPALERYVRAATTARVARDELVKDGVLSLTTRGSQGQLVQHPNVKTAREAERDAHAYAEALLLTPAARKKADLKPPPKRSKLAEALGA